MSDLPEQHVLEKPNDTISEESRKVEEEADTKPEAEGQAEAGGKEREVEVKELVEEKNPSATDEKKADEDVTVNEESIDVVVDKAEQTSQVKDVHFTSEAKERDGPRMAEEKDDGVIATEDNVEHEINTTEAGKASAGNDPVSTTVSADPSPAVSLAALRPLSPSSRTSTPPLTATTTAPAAKKFSAMNVNKKFLSKTGSPSPVGATSATKLNPSASMWSHHHHPQLFIPTNNLGRPISSPVPIAPSSRLLSTTLTTVTSKPSVSPQPPTSASTSSPWAKPVLPASDSSSSGLHQPVPNKRGAPFTSAAPMGSGQGIAAKPAWRAVGADGRRAGMGVNRDFPTASEVAEGE